MLVLDTNVLLYLSDESSAPHTSTITFVTDAIERREVIGIPWICAIGFVRIATNRKVFTKPLTYSRAIDFLKGWFSLPGVVPVEPGPQHLDLLSKIMTGRRECDATDAHIAAIAQERGATVVTFDRDFARFEVPVARPTDD